MSVVDPNLRYEVLSYDPKRKRARLRGKESEFEMISFTPERLAQMGFKLVNEEDLPALEPLPVIEAPKPPTESNDYCSKCTAVRGMFSKCHRRKGRVVYH